MVSVFAAPFELDAACIIAGRPAAQLLDMLGRLVDWNLISLRSGSPTRYRVLETIRQYADERSVELGEHLDNSRRASELGEPCAGRSARPRPPATTPGAPRSTESATTPEPRSTGPPRRRSAEADAAAARRTARRRVVPRGRLAEAQRRYEQAAELTDDGVQRRRLLLLAAGQRAHPVRRRRGDRPDRSVSPSDAESEQDFDAAAIALARIVTISHRHEGTMPTPHHAPARSTRCWNAPQQLGSSDARVEAAIAVAMVGRGGYEVRQRDDAERAVRLARDAADPLLLDGALDQLTAAQFDAGEFVEAAETVRRRLAGLAAFRSTR